MWSFGWQGVRRKKGRNEYGLHSFTLGQTDRGMGSLSERGNAAEEQVWWNLTI